MQVLLLVASCTFYDHPDFVQGSLTTYNYFDNVWKFDLSDATFKLTQRAQGALAGAPKLSTGKIKVICVESTLFNSAANP